MADPSEPPAGDEERPYVWPAEGGATPEVVQLWNEVGNGLEKNQTVVWKSSVDSLEQARHFLPTSKEAREFVEKYMEQIVGILVEQQPAKIGHHERQCVQESLLSAVAIVADDLKIQVERNGDCKLLNCLNHIFNRKKAFYKGSKGSWNVNHLQGLPEVRMKLVDTFRGLQGFQMLQAYLKAKVGTPQFPPFDTLYNIIPSLCDTTHPPAPEDEQAMKTIQDDGIAVANVVLEHIDSFSDDDLKKLPTEGLVATQKELRKIFDRLIATRRKDAYHYYEFWRALTLKLISSNSLPLKLFGWEQIDYLIAACEEQRPPPQSFTASNAGVPFANGEYMYNGEVTLDGYARFPQGGDVTYVRAVPQTEEGGGKKLTLFRCTMRSQQKWWFLSEADEEQPGTDRDIDYYQHKTKDNDEVFPPADGWITCRTAGVDPPPNLKAKGVVVPEGEEFNTLEHQLAKWAIENEIVEQVLGDSTIHREIVARSTELIKFLAYMCDKDQPTEAMTDGAEPNKYCLQVSHLLFAWKTCTRKADAAVSTQLYQLLVSILHLCPSDLSIPLLKAIQTSLLRGEDDRDHLLEVAEFCSALASANLVDAKARTGGPLADDVRDEVLILLWSVLTHPNASSLKSYDVLKRYVTHELRVEPKGSEHRERFLKYCVKALSEFALQRGDTVIDEVQALRTVQLTNFLLEACPRDQCARLVTDGSGALPLLLFKELVAYLERRKKGVGASGFKKSISAVSSLTSSSDTDAKLHENAMHERLRILRQVYGLHHSAPGEPDPNAMSLSMVENLWELCDTPEDREALMIFIARASHDGKEMHHNQQSVNGPNVSPDQMLSAAFSIDVCQSIFVKLFCSPSFDYRQLGERAYSSFQYLFNRIRTIAGASPESKRASLDALWRLCLTVSSDTVALQVMKDLLSVYVPSPNDTGASEEMSTGDAGEGFVIGFADRIFQCLAKVKSDLDMKTDGAERSAQRCLRILNAAVGLAGSEGASWTNSALMRLSALVPTATLGDAARSLPHGLRGQVCYRRIGIQAKRQGSSSNQIQSTNSTASVGPKASSTVKFAVNVHPLETLASLKYKVATYCSSTVNCVKPVQVHGRSVGSSGRAAQGDPSQMNLSAAPEDCVMAELGIVNGCEVIFMVSERPPPINPTIQPTSFTRSQHSHDMSAIFFDEDGKFSDKLFEEVLGILDVLSWPDSNDMTDSDTMDVDSHKLIWDLLNAMPTYTVVNSQIMAAVAAQSGDTASTSSKDDAMEVESLGMTWAKVLDVKNFSRSVYVLLAIDALLQPAPESLSVVAAEQRLKLEKAMIDGANSFRQRFIESGGFDSVVKFFSASGSASMKQGQTRRGNAVALRILKSCLFGTVHDVYESGGASSTGPDEAGSRLLQSMSDAEGLLKSLVSMVVDDSGISSSTITDVLRFLRLLFQSDSAAQSFLSLPDRLAPRFLFDVLVWDESSGNARSASSEMASMNVRRSGHDLILVTSQLAEHALPWLIKGIADFDADADMSYEYFDVLEKLVGDEKDTARSRKATDQELTDLSTAVCKKLVACPRPTSEADIAAYTSNGVLCGCLKILRALIENGGGAVLRPGTEILVTELGVARWSEIIRTPAKGLFAAVSSGFRPQIPNEDTVLIDLMGVMFDGFLTPIETSSVAICAEKESRGRGFDVVGAAARFCKGGDGYMALVHRIDGLITSASPQLRHQWGQFGTTDTHNTRHGRATSKYSGLRNQGCTCYMNSLLQQLFMTPELRDSMCAAPLPSSLRSSAIGVSSSGADLVGKKITLQWDSGVGYDALVESFDEVTGMHTIRYQPIQVATVGGSGSASTQHRQVDPSAISKLPECLPDEFVLAQGRAGKETGVFELVKESSDMEGVSTSDEKDGESKPGEIVETEDEAASRHLLEEVQRTFIHLKEGSRGRCFDPRALVEACACLKLEFDVWQQNDASEFATKLLDRLEISLKRWAPSHFRFMDHMFGLKQTKQKICKECGLKTNREEKLLNIDCQIRGKADIHEALAAMTEVEIMEGSNKVFCETCKKNTDTVLRTAISTLPNMLILSLKRFDLDFTTFETVKLNSRCAFGQTLNMKPYTLEGLESDETPVKKDDSSEMDTTSVDADVPAIEEENAASALPDEDYEFKLAGVLVHAGVAQGGHYYSFIKDRSVDGEEKWFRFDDEDVTPFDPAAIENECFGGKVKKETKWPNGQVHTVESEQFANALMLFYEKVKTTDPPSDEEDTEESSDRSKSISTMSGYDAFQPDVHRSNASHRWQTFLFDPEFQSFMKGLLGVCRVSNFRPDVVPADAATWRPVVTQMLLSFFFDVFLYSTDRSLDEWTRLFEEALSADQASALAFVRKLARKTREVSGNWLRSYLLECPNLAARIAALHVFCAAIKSATSYVEERQSLQNWTLAWKEYTTELENGLPDEKPYTCLLGGRWLAHEDIEKLESGEASSIGIIISFLNVMLDNIPRYWRYCSETGLLIRLLATTQIADSETTFREPMIAASIAGRLIALVTRERTPQLLANAFPGSSVPEEVANTQIRAETSSTSHAMPITGNQVMNTSDMNNTRGPSADDMFTLLEALACLAKLPFEGEVELIRSDAVVRGLEQRFTFTDQCVNALTTIFQESCSPGAPGMGQRDIENYLERTGNVVDHHHGHIKEKINNMLSKYPTAESQDGSTAGGYLSLEGFLTYYQDACRSNELKLRHDLHVFGFAPDLSRRSPDSRLVTIGDRQQNRMKTESVAIDVSEKLNDRPLSLGKVANYALIHSVHLYTIAQRTCEPLAEYLLAAGCYRQDVTNLINETLRAVYTAPNEWQGNELVTSTATMILQVIASSPSDSQEQRITRIMLSEEKVNHHAASYGIGLLRVARTLYDTQNQRYGDFHYGFDRYVNVLKELRNVYSVFRWMQDHRPEWSFLERELMDPSHGHGNVPNPMQMRGGFNTHHMHGDGFNSHGLENTVQHDHHTQSDSDMAGINDSDEEDDDSRFDTYEQGSVNDGPQHVYIDNAGEEIVNGVYVQDGFMEGGCKYVKEVEWDGRPAKLHIFKCNVSNNTKHWYMSIVPAGAQPGTSSDIDFYTVPEPADPGPSGSWPPQGGWVPAKEGAHPAPMLQLSPHQIDTGGDSPERTWNGGTHDEDGSEDPMQPPYV